MEQRRLETFVPSTERIPLAKARQLNGFVGLKRATFSCVILFVQNFFDLWRSTSANPRFIRCDTTIVRHLHSHGERAIIQLVANYPESNTDHFNQSSLRVMQNTTFMLDYKIEVPSPNKFCTPTEFDVRIRNASCTTDFQEWIHNSWQVLPTSRIWRKLLECGQFQKCNSFSQGNTIRLQNTSIFLCCVPNITYSLIRRKYAWITEEF